MREERIDIRAAVEVKEFIQKAADIVGSSMSSFILMHAYEAAASVIKEQEVLYLSGKDREQVLSLLVNPPEPNDALCHLMQQQ